RQSESCAADEQDQGAKTIDVTSQLRWGLFGSVRARSRRFGLKGDRPERTDDTHPIFRSEQDQGAKTIDVTSQLRWGLFGSVRARSRRFGLKGDRPERTDDTHPIF